MPLGNFYGEARRAGATRFNETGSCSAIQDRRSSSHTPRPRKPANEARLPIVSPSSRRQDHLYGPGTKVKKYYFLNSIFTLLFKQVYERRKQAVKEGEEMEI